MVERDLFRLALPNPRTLTLLSRCPRWAVDTGQSPDLVGGEPLKNQQLASSKPRNHGDKS